MDNPFAISSLFCLVVIGAVLARDTFTRRYEIFSYRSLFLFGYAIFFPIAAFLTFPGMAAAPEAIRTLAIAQVVFLIVFLVSSRIAQQFGWLERVVPKDPVAPSFPLLLTWIFTLLIMGSAAAAVTRGGFGVLYIANIKSGLLATSVALAVYLLVSRKLNPISLAIVVGTVPLALAASTVGTSGRRGMLSVMLAGAWMWYFASMRYQKLSSMLARFAVAGVAVVFVVTAYSTFRHSLGGAESEALARQATALRQGAANVQFSKDSFLKNLYQDSADNTVFIIETYGSAAPHNPLHGIAYYILNPIPRAVIGFKPEALGIELQKKRNATANLGPGIIGHGWYESGWIGIIGYAVVFGFVLSVIDLIVQRRAYSPVLLAPLGASLGNVMALPRGDTPLFAASITAEFIAPFLILYTIALFGRGFFGAFAPVYPRVWLEAWARDWGLGEGEYADGDDPYDDYDAAPAGQQSVAGPAA